MNPEDISSVLSMGDPDDRDWAILELVRQASPNDTIETLENLASNIGSSYERAMALIELFERCRVTNRLRALEYLDKSLESSYKADERWQPPELLSKIGSCYFEADEPDKAMATWSQAIEKAKECLAEASSQDTFSCSDILGGLAVKLAEFRLDDKAAEVANLIPIEKIRLYAIERIDAL